jgi:hypothetical protein
MTCPPREGRTWTLHCTPDAACVCGAAGAGCGCWGNGHACGVCGVAGCSGRGCGWAGAPARRNAHAARVAGAGARRAPHAGTHAAQRAYAWPAHTHTLSFRVFPPTQRKQVWRTPHAPATLRPSLASLPRHFRAASVFHLGVHPNLADLNALAELRAAAEASAAAASASASASARLPRGGVLSIEPFTTADRQLVRAVAGLGSALSACVVGSSHAHALTTHRVVPSLSFVRRMLSCARSAPRRTSCRPTRRKPSQWHALACVLVASQTRVLCLTQCTHACVSPRRLAPRRRLSWWRASPPAARAWWRCGAGRRAQSYTGTARSGKLRCTFALANNASFSIGTNALTHAHARAHGVAVRTVARRGACLRWAVLQLWTPPAAATRSAAPSWRRGARATRCWTPGSGCVREDGRKEARCVLCVCVQRR